jgi:hypothetical protein
MKKRKDIYGYSFHYKGGLYPIPGWYFTWNGEIYSDECTSWFLHMIPKDYIDIIRPFSQHVTELDFANSKLSISVFETEDDIQSALAALKFVGKESF